MKTQVFKHIKNNKNNFYDAFLSLLKEQDMIIGQLAVCQNVLLI